MTLTQKIFKLQIISHEKLYFDGDVEAVFVPAVNGRIGILPRHVSLVSQLTKGEIKVVKQKNKEETFDIEGGFINVDQEKVSLMVF